jgi:ribosomal protein L3
MLMRKDSWGHRIRKVVCCGKAQEKARAVLKGKKVWGKMGN